MPSNEELIEEYKKKRARIEQMAAPEVIEKRHKEGQWTARERLNYFFDPNTFTEIGMFVKQRSIRFGRDKREIPVE